MIYPSIPLAQAIITICKAKGIQHIIISPGSRNAPLTIGFANDPFFKCYSIADERCAAFFALGIAQQLMQPVVVVCTSGSAVLNYYPAFAEAFYSLIPLIVISADRPLDKIDIGDGQTIRQANVFENHSLFNANLTEEASETNDLLINQAINTAITGSGPVHINAPFEEPLYETTSVLVREASLLSANLPKETMAINDQEFVINHWHKASKKMILVGTNMPNQLSEAVIAYLGSDPSVVVLTETTSNLHHPNFVHTIDTLITPYNEETFEFLKPEILITFGGMVVSKRIKAFLRNYKPLAHWHIDSHRAYDTFGVLTNHFKISPATFFETLLPAFEKVSSNYAETILQQMQIRALKKKIFLKQAPFSDLTVFHFIAQHLPKNIQLQLANSSTIRYVQLFDFDPSIIQFCNRGTSGIDGSTSTAIGAALVSAKPTVFITGDISFFYDSNALWNAYIPKNFKIILVNNEGGGIFRILPGHQESPVFNTYFETSHHYTAEKLAAMYGFDYTLVSDIETLAAQWQSFIAACDAPQLLEIQTPTLDNDKQLKAFFKNLT